MIAAVPSVVNPFPGLRSFEASETHLFFGREEQSDALLRKLEHSRFLAVVGTSGSGKSSLVQAGLIPSLESGYMASAGSQWKVAVLRPGGDPIHSLAQALTPYYALGETSFDEETRCVLVETTLRRSSLGLRSVAREAGLAASDNLLIIVDQFEEIFRFRRNKASGWDLFDNTAAFVKLLLEAAAAPDEGVFIVLTMRSDFLGDCAEFPDLPEAINEGQYLIPRMTREERRRAIEGPTAVGGASITERLVQRLLNDVGDNPDQLPVLQHALMRTWTCWQDSGNLNEPIDIPHYDSIGGISRALSIHADEAFHSLATNQQAIARELFQALCEKSVDGRETRRPTKLAEICEITEQPEHEVVEVIDAFRTQRRTFLMPPHRERLGPDSVVDISHESLIRLWERLREWVEEEAQFAATYRRLADSGLRFQEGAVSLWRDPELRLASDWKRACEPNQAWGERYHPAFAPAMAFLEQSQRARDVQRRRRRFIFAGLILSAVCFGVLAFVALWMWRDAEREKQNAIAAQGRADTNARVAREHATRADAATAEAQKERDHSKAAESRANLSAAEEKASAARLKRTLDEKEGLQKSLQTRYLANKAAALKSDPQSLETSALLASESLRLDPSSEGRSTLLETLMLLPDFALPKSVDEGDAFRTFMRKGVMPSEGEIVGTQFTPDNTHVLLIRKGSTSSASSLEIVEVESGKVGANFEFEGIISKWNLDVTGKYLAVSDQSQTVRILETGNGKVSFTQRFDAVTAIGLSAGARRLAIGAQSGTLTILDTTTRAKVTEVKLPASVNTVEFHSDGRSVIAACADRSAHIVDFAGGAKVTSLGQEAIDLSIFSPEGSHLVSGNKQGRLRLFSSRGEAIWNTWAGGGVTSIAFSRDGKTLATGNSDRSIRLLDALSGRELRSIEFGDIPDRVEFSPDGRLIAAADAFRTLRVFGTATGVEFMRTLTFSKVAESSSFSSDSRYLAIGGNVLKVIRNRDGELRGVQGDDGIAQLSPDEKFLAVNRSAGLLKVYEAQGRRELWKTNLGSPFLWCVFSQDSRYLATADEQARATVFELATGKQITQIKELVYTENARGQAVPSLSGNGAYVATGNSDRHAQVFDTRTKQEIFRAGYGGPVTAVALDTNGEHLAVASDRVRIYDLKSKRMLRRLETGNTATSMTNPFGKNITATLTITSALAFSPDGRILAVASHDKTIRLFAVESGSELLKVQHQGVIYGVRFSPDGKRLIVTEGLSRIIVHHIDSAELVEQACSRLTRNLTISEWKLYFGNEPYRKSCPSLP